MTIRDCIGNSAKLSILMAMKRKGPMTAKQMLQEGVDIPQTTLYRLLKNMESAGVLDVVSETKVRGTTEKTYYIGEVLRDFDEDIVKNNNLDEYCRLFGGFAFNLYGEFEDYCKREGANIIRDGSDFSMIPVYATSEEIGHLMKEIRKLLIPYMERTSDVQGLHTFAAIFTPPCDVELDPDGKEGTS